MAKRKTRKNINTANNKINEANNSINVRKKGNNVILKSISEGSTVESRVMVDDPFSSFYGGENGDIILEPPYNPNQLSKLREESDILGACIDAYVTNIVGLGYTIDNESYDDENANDEDFQKYEELFKYCNFDMTFTEIMKRVIADRESVGWGAFEVVRDALNEPSGFTHIPAQQLRLCSKQSKSIDVVWHVRDKTGNARDVTVKKRFRKFVQIINGKLMYFKEFGDPRTMDCTNGKYNDDVPEEKQATEVVFFNNYCPYTAYGLPRYMGHLLNMVGNREAQELNFNYFKSGRHIPSAIVVNGGHLTEQSEKALKESVGKKAQHKYIILECEANEKPFSIDGDESQNKVSMDIKPLATMIQEDGLFLNYCNNNRNVIRSAFRLPPIYTGESQDYNKATADTAKAVTEEQVFQPERASLQDAINNLFKNAIRVFDVTLTFKAPVINDDEAKANTLKAYAEMGGVTPNMALAMACKVTGERLELFNGDWANVPLMINTQEEQPIQKTDADVSDVLKSIEELKNYCEEVY